MTAALQIVSLHKRFGSRQVLDGFSLQVARGEVVDLGSVPELLARVPGQAAARMQSRDNAATVQRVQALGWAVRRHARRLSCLLPRSFSLREVVVALDGSEVSAVSVQAVTLEDAYLELVGEGAAVG